MNLHRIARTVHRWLAWLIGLQLLAWLVGGVVFAWLPFQPWVKAQDMVGKPVVDLGADWPAQLQAALAASAPAAAVRGVAAVPGADGALWRLTLADGRVHRLRADGRPWTAPEGRDIERYAQALYRGGGRMVGTAERMSTAPARLGIVQEMAGRRDLWRVRFDDTLGTRLYFDGEGGEFLTARTEAWVWYDLLWRLHIMDYTGGDDFNNALLRGAAPLALLMGLAGTVVALQAGWFRLQGRRRRLHGASGG
ncbi:MAG: hypothetical protein ACKVQR_09475 [Aquabacterium sp.]